MVPMARPKGYWTFERCEKEAKKYLTRLDFQKGSSSYQAAQRNRWLDKICTHMEKGANGFHYMVYAILNLKAKKAYIGITKQQFFKRVAQHKFNAIKGARNRSKEIALLEDTEYIALTDYIIVSTAVKKAETNWARKYASKGFSILNEDIRFGSLGPSSTTYSDKDIAEEARKYTTKISFLRGCPRYYDAARRRGILDEVCNHMMQVRKPKNHWTLEKCIEAASSCTLVSDFRINYAGAYGAARVNGWLDEIYAKSHLC
jgi:predicted GIY-YIG superfamily endonuclease